ncbi:MAG: YggT family protein [Betaproteobacteria bacterium]|nr:YggT family protein [Betaproteobacteria bacterium]
MLAQTLIFLLTTVGDLFVLALLLRFVLQWLRAPARNQLSEFLAALTNFIVLPARRVIPGWWGLDLATLVVAWLVAALQLWLVLQIKGYELGSAAGVALAAVAALAAIDIARLAVYVVMIAVVLQAVLSWVNPQSALAPVLTVVTRPFLRPFQKVVPTVANVDLSPLIVLLICQLLIAVPLLWLEKAVGRLL